MMKNRNEGSFWGLLPRMSRATAAGLIACAAAASLILTACGASHSNGSYAVREEKAEMTRAETAAAAAAPQSGMGGAMYDEAFYDAEEAADYEYGMETTAAPAPALAEGSTGSGTGAEQIPDPTIGKKLIYRYDMSAETQDLTAETARIEAAVVRYGGYIESSYLSEPSSSYRYSSRSSTYQIRIPTRRAEQFLNETSETLNVTERSSNVEDITANYTDTEARKISLETEEKRLLEILAKAETVEDLIAVESRLSEVRYERESLVRTLRTFDNQVAYSTISLSIREVREYTEEEPESVSQRISKGFAKSIKDVKEGLTDFFVWVVTHSPQIVIWIIVIVILWTILKAIGRAAAARKVKKMAEKAKKAAALSPEERAAAEEQEKKIHRFLFGSGRKRKQDVQAGKTAAGTKAPEAGAGAPEAGAGAPEAEKPGAGTEEKQK